MTRFSILALVALALAACRTESPSDATDAADSTAATTASADAPAIVGGLETPDPRRIDGAEQTTRTASLRALDVSDGTCYVVGSDSEGEILLTGTPEVCQEGAALVGQTVTLTEEPAKLDVDLGDESIEQDLTLVVGIAPAE